MSKSRMTMIRFTQLHSLRRRTAALLALVAMAMLFLGPLISQVESAERHHGMAGMSHSGMPGMMPMGEMPKAAVFHWFDQCGYCSLWQHFPTAHIHVPAVARDALKPAGRRIQSPVSSAADAPTFPNALSRAPPMLS